MSRVNENQWPITRGSTATGINDGFLVLHVSSGEYGVSAIGPPSAYWGEAGSEAIVVPNEVDRVYEILMTGDGTEASLYRLP